MRCKAEGLLRLLARRFGPLPDDVRLRIASADSATLDIWLDGVLVAPGLSAVFDGEE